MTDETDEQEESVSTYWEMRCPRCKKDDRICILASTYVCLTPDGTDESESICGGEDWDEHSPATCCHCNFDGEVQDFNIPDEEQN